MMERPDRDEWLMRLVTVISTRGTCNRAQVGALVAREGRIISTGYVGAPAGLPHCSDAGDAIGPDGGCTRTVHAEANAIAFAARYGTSTEGSELYCTHSPCINCAKLIINSGIRRFVFEHQYRDASGLALLQIAGLDVIKLPAGVELESAPVVDPDEDYTPLGRTRKQVLDMTPHEVLEWVKAGGYEVE
jgi:dCMP deaminase